ncbi:MAG: Holliday junction branch migration protein RuvA [Bdellovibrionales bacterium]
MIAYIRGTVKFVGEESITVDVGGVGYELLCSANSLDQFPLDRDVEALVYTHAREDVLQLFGFAKAMEKELFLSLIKVNGIGPKMANQILSGARTEQIIQMIEEGDVKSLMKLPKLGKKKAEQLVLSLKGKLVFADPVDSSLSTGSREIKSALVNLGYKEADVIQILQQIPETENVETGIRKGLSLLSAGV